MPRNGSGTYSLPTGNPVVAGTTIEPSWANTTLNDVATEMTGSLARSGSGGMTGPLRLDAGTAAVPALAWSTETTTGLYRAGTNDVRLAVATSDVMRWQAAGVSVTGTLGVSAAATFSTTLAVTGAATLSSTLAVTGTTTLTGAATLTANPTLSAGTANGVLYLDGSKVASSGSALTFDGTNLATTGTASATKLIPTGGSATGNGMYLPAANALAWSNNGAETMRLDASGNLGLGVTPSAWESTCRMLQLGAVGTVGRANSGQTQIGFNYFINSSGQYVYIQSLHATRHEQISGEHRFFTAASGTAGNTITFTQAMTLDASGNLGIGTTSPTTKLDVSSTATEVIFQDSDTAKGSSPTALLSYHGSDGRAGYIGYPADSSLYIYNQNNAATLFGTNNAERMRLDASGNLGIGTASPGAKLEVYGGASGTTTNIGVGNAATGFVLGVDASNNCQVRTAQNVAMLFYTNATQRMQISADGNVFVGTAALATTATAGFPWIPSCPGVPTGAPTAPYTNAAAMVVDTTNNRLYVRVGSTWRYATLT
jgi:hypothetical protein